MLTLDNFLSFSDDVKLDIVKKHGRYLTYRKLLLGRVLLFYLSDFYVEIYVDEEVTTSKFIGTLQTTEKIDPYLKEIRFDLPLD